MFNFLKRKNGDMPVINENQIVAITDGKAIPIESVNDPVFSEKLLGDGIAIVPTGTTVVAPGAGKITMIAQTSHAFGMECDNGLEILVHIGIDTVSLDGKGFTVLAQVGSHVEAGTPIISFDPAVMRKAGLDLTTPVVILDDGGKQITMHYPEKARAGVTVMMECV